MDNDFSKREKLNNFRSGPYAEGYGLPQGASQFMADPMFKAAQQFGGQFAEQQKDKVHSDNSFFK